MEELIDQRFQSERTARLEVQKGRWTRTIKRMKYSKIKIFGGFIGDDKF